LKAKKKNAWLLLQKKVTLLSWRKYIYNIRSVLKRFWRNRKWKKRKNGKKSNGRKKAGKKRKSNGKTKLIEASSPIFIFE